VARYLLGRAYRIAQRYDEAIAILEKLLVEYPEEFRAAIDFALAIERSSGDRSKAIAVMHLAGLYGLGDPRFVATFGGMLFVAGKNVEAAKVFEETVKREFPAEEANKARYWPVDKDGLPLTFQGRTVLVRPGYCLIEVEGTKPFISPAHRWAGIAPKMGQTIKFSLAFSAKGPVAEKLVIAS
jgi:tetratricopeptide (TPR) repeat protein